MREECPKGLFFFSLSGRVIGTRALKRQPGSDLKVEQELHLQLPYRCYLVQLALAGSHALQCPLPERSGRLPAVSEGGFLVEQSSWLEMKKKC